MELELSACWLQLPSHVVDTWVPRTITAPACVSLLGAIVALDSFKSLRLSSLSWQLASCQRSCLSASLEWPTVNKSQRFVPTLWRAASTWRAITLISPSMMAAMNTWPSKCLSPLAFCPFVWPSLVVPAVSHAPAAIGGESYITPCKSMTFAWSPQMMMSEHKGSNNVWYKVMGLSKDNSLKQKFYDISSRIQQAKHLVACAWFWTPLFLWGFVFYQSLGRPDNCTKGSESGVVLQMSYSKQEKKMPHVSHLLSIEGDVCRSARLPSSLELTCHLLLCVFRPPQAAQTLGISDPVVFKTTPGPWSSVQCERRESSVEAPPW